MIAVTITSDGVSQGIFALLGVLVGGLITAGTTLYVERRRDRRAVRAAARLLGEALRHVHIFAWSAEREESWPYWGDDAFTQVETLWTEHEALFAAAVRPGQWDALTQAVEGGREIDRLRPNDQKVPERPPLTTNESNLLEFAHARVEVGVRVLRRIAGVPVLTQDAWTRLLWRKRLMKRLKSLIP
jgi:hypothetical protein